MLEIRNSYLQILLFTGIFLIGCNPNVGSQSRQLEVLPLTYASGFSVMQGDGYKVVEVTQAFPEKHQPFLYLVLENGNTNQPDESFDAVIRLPAKRIVLTSTTQIPHLDYLAISDYLIGFPNLNLISSATTRALIDAGKVEDLGSGAQANIERILDLNPDLIMISTLGEDLKNLEILKSAGIPAVLNGEYVEQHPLGRAEWIKFTGALLGKFEEASAAFVEIEKSYLEAEQLTATLTNEKPKVMAGVMYKDIWYVPGGESWGARLLKAAGGDYLFEAQKGTGSSQLSYEYVLDQAGEADFWLGASDFTSLSTMKNADPRYGNFKAFELGQVYSYTSKKGATGGLEYFELGYLRPDLILRDIIKILHPELLPDYQLYFYSQLNE